MTSRIFLTGFMTSGKSTVGPILANVLGWNFIDLDKAIESNTGMKINDIFLKYGETEFRRIESKFLFETSKENNIVIALGGGAIANNKNLEFVKSNGKLIYLKCSPEILYKRLKHKTDRPLVKEFVENKVSADKFIDRIKNMLQRREGFYNQADLIISTDDINIGLTVDKIANKIIKQIDE